MTFPQPLITAQQLREYKQGEKVRILRGKLAGEVLTVHQSANDWVMLEELPGRHVMSKGNVEPQGGFTEDELAQARRVGGMGK